MTSETGDRFWALVCQYEHLLQVLIALLAFFLLLSAVSLFAVNPGSGTFLVVMLNFALFTPGLIVVSIVLYKCRNR